ncbi:YybH family protein [Lichenihabitans psoromatis]|uniref:YybH family protein n=1 Tax=Lichenihabitans psoromatis TaxID=2528642 RepID=UPI0013F16EEC|nr:SgcJ/EcaC family oxidoreductase [Lichenihabitans psoromatis]
MNADEQSAAALLKAYGHAANAADAHAIAALYAPDGVLMAQNMAPCVGNEAVHQAYAGMFQAIALDIAFSIAELRQIAPDWVLARTTSTGTIKLLATGADIPEANQELFLFQRIDAAWKIARYCFNTTLPAQG